MATTTIQQQFAVFLLPLSHKGTKLEKIRPRVFCTIETNVGFQYKDFRPADMHRLQHKCTQLNISILTEVKAEGEHVE